MDFTVFSPLAAPENNRIPQALRPSIQRISVFVIVQFYLQQEVQGKNTALQRLNAQIAELSDLLSMEKAGNANLEKQLGGVQASLATAQSERDKYKSSYEAAAANAATAQGKVNDLSKYFDTIPHAELLRCV
jgi:chemotaxis protein MotB